MPPKLKEIIDTEESPGGTTENQNTHNAGDDDVIVTGTSYATQPREAKTTEETSTKQLT